MDSEQERALIEKAKNDKQAFGLLYDEYYKKIFGYVLTRTANVQISQDITSETFAKALNSIKRFTWQGIPFSAWLCRIANHEIANYYRQNGHGLVLMEKISESIVLELETPEEEIEKAEEKLSKRQAFLSVHDKMSRLPLKYQEVLALRFFEEKKVEEISAILGKNKGVVNNLLYRGLARLQTMLQQDGAPNRHKHNSLKEVECGEIRII